jgi:hypothetical protein
LPNQRPWVYAVGIFGREDAAMTALELRVLKMALEALGRVLADPPTLTQALLQILERDQAAVLAAQYERSELALEKSSQARELAEARRVHDEALRSERMVWDREVAERRARLRIDEDETARRREFVDKDREQAAALREQLKARVERKAGVAPERGEQRVTAAA